VFDLRYHVASLAAVFIALVLGILVGVGISGRGLIKESERRALQADIDGLQGRLDAANARLLQQDALESYQRDTYPAVMEQRLRDHRVGIVFVGSLEGELGASVQETIDVADGTRVVRALKIPTQVGRLLEAVSGVPDAPLTVDDLGRALGAELVDGGDTPLWDAVGPTLVEEREGSLQRPLDAVVVARTAEPQRGLNARFLAGLYSGLAASGVPVAGVETTDADPRSVPTFASHGFSTVDDVETTAGRVALAALLEGGQHGSFGIKGDADAVLPRVEPVVAAGG